VLLTICVQGLGGTLGKTFFSSMCASSDFVFGLGLIGNLASSSFYSYCAPFVLVRMKFSP
jgi:hypothetical protein